MCVPVWIVTLMAIDFPLYISIFGVLVGLVIACYLARTVRLPYSAHPGGVAALFSSGFIAMLGFLVAIHFELSSIEPRTLFALLAVIPMAVMQVYSYVQKIN